MAELHKIHETHFTNLDTGDGLERIRSNLSVELGEVSTSIAKGVDGNLKLAAELRRSLRDLAGKVTREELQLVCRHLVYSGREQLSDTQSLAERLERTQYQLTEMHAELTVLRERGARDSLTGLHNSTRFIDQLEACLAERTPFCVVLIDLDNVRELTADWGTSVRDNMLRGIGRLLQNQLKGQDLAARIGPHSFGLVLPDTPLGGAAAVADTVLARFAKITWVSQTTDQEIGQQSLSIGLTDRRGDESSATLQDRAAQHLAAAQQAGGSCVAGASTQDA